jgi:hypothetical protein
MPKVSIVIPTRNRAKLLRRAVGSVLRQTYADWEALIVDDASSDDTGEVVQRICDRRVHYRRHEVKGGVSAARNTAIAHSTGQYVAFLDDDDEWFPEKLASQIECFDRLSTAVGLVYSGHEIVPGGIHPVPVEVGPVLRGHVFDCLLRHGFLGHTSTIVVRAECFEKAGLFDVAFRYEEDLDMWLRIARVYEVDFVGACLVRTCLQADGYNRDYEAQASGREAHLDKYRDYFAQNRDVLHARLQELGLRYCLAGQTRKGRQTFFRAISCGRLDRRSCLCFALSLAGPWGFRAGLAAREALLLHLGSRRRTAR